MTATAAPRKAKVRNLLTQMHVVQLDAEHPAVDALLSAYRAKFGLGPRDRATERATLWTGMEYEGRIIAVFGERQEARVIEITDAYFDGTQEGKAAFAVMCYAYRGRLNAGECDTLVHTILYANDEHWRAIIRETGDPPAVLTFLHRRKGE